MLFDNSTSLWPRSRKCWVEVKSRARTAVTQAKSSRLVLFQNRCVPVAKAALGVDRPVLSILCWPPGMVAGDSWALASAPRQQRLRTIQAPDQSRGLTPSQTRGQTQARTPDPLISGIPVFLRCEPSRSSPPLLEAHIVNSKTEPTWNRRGGEQDSLDSAAVDSGEGRQRESVLLPLLAGDEILGRRDGAAVLGKHHNAIGFAVAFRPETNLLLGREVSGGEGLHARGEHGAGPGEGCAGHDLARHQQCALAALGASLHHSHLRGRLTAHHGIGGNHPAGAESGLGLAAGLDVVEIAYQTKLARRARRARLRSCRGALRASLGASLAIETVEHRRPGSRGIRVSVHPKPYNQERYYEDEGQQLVGGGDRVLLVPAEKLPGEQKAAGAGDHQRQQLCRVSRERLPSGHHPLERGHQVGGGQEDGHALDPMRQHGERKGSPGKKEQREPDQVVVDL